MRILACDPGVQPTLCLMEESEDGLLLVRFWSDADTSVSKRVGKSVRHRPSAGLLRHVMQEAMPVDRLVLEDVGTRPGEGPVGSFTFGYTSGLLEGIAVGLGIKVVRVRPQVWKKELAFPANATKDYARHIASMIAPHAVHFWQRKKDHNRADSFCMAYWGRGHEAA